MRGVRNKPVNVGADKSVESAIHTPADFQAERRWKMAVAKKVANAVRPSSSPKNSLPGSQL